MYNNKFQVYRVNKYDGNINAGGVGLRAGWIQENWSSMGELWGCDEDGDRLYGAGLFYLGRGCWRF